MDIGGAQMQEAKIVAMVDRNIEVLPVLEIERHKSNHLNNSTVIQFLK